MANIQTFIQNTGLTLTHKRESGAEYKRLYKDTYTLTIDNRVYTEVCYTDREPDTIEQVLQDIQYYIDTHESDKDTFEAVYKEVITFLGEYLSDFKALNL